MDYFDQNWGLKDRRAVVTGASRGIGRAIAEALASVGVEVLVHYNTGREEAQQVKEQILANGGKAWTFQADLTRAEDVDRLFKRVKEEWGALDILVNNAGSLIQRCKIEDLSDALIEQVMGVNFHTALYSIRAAIALLRMGKDPSIVNITSIAAHSGGASGSVLYAAMKGALISLTRGLAKEIGPEIRVNAIAPAAVPTDFLKTTVPQERLKSIAEAAPLKRLGRTEDTAAAVVFLCGQGASYITGEVLDVSGGRRLAY